MRAALACLALLVTGCFTAAGAGTGAIVAGVQIAGDELPPRREVLPRDAGVLDLVAQTRAAAEQGHCRLARTLGAEIAARDPAFHDGVLVHERAMRECRPSRAAPIRTGAKLGLLVDLVLVGTFIVVAGTCGPGC